MAFKLVFILDPDLWVFLLLPWPQVELAGARRESVGAVDSEVGPGQESNNERPRHDTRLSRTRDSLDPPTPVPAEGAGFGGGGSTAVAPRLQDLTGSWAGSIQVRAWGT